MRKIYKIGDKITTGCLIIYFSKSNLPLTDDAHRNLLMLSRGIDTFFIFSRDTKKLFYPTKIATLYGARYYSLESDNNEVSNTWNSIEYVKELYGYSCVSYINSEDLKCLTDKEIKNTIALQYSPLEKSVFETWTRDNDRFKDIYTRSSYSWKDLFIPNPRYDIDMYSRMETTNNSLFLRTSSIINIQNFLDTDNTGYLNTFRETNFKIFISSVIEKVCPDTKININIEDANY